MRRERPLRFVGIITRHETPDVRRLGEDLALWCQEQGLATLLDEVQPDMDLIIVLGGDGTLLHVATQAAKYAIPILGINCGHLGFLTEVAVEEMYATLATVLEGKIRLEKRMMLTAAFVSGDDGTKSKPISALNEVVIVKDSTERMVRLRCWADCEYIATYRADGLILATPTGSTAYNLSAGGPIVHPELDTILVTPICPFMLESRPVLLSPESSIIAHLLAPDGDVKVIVDGVQQWKISDNDYLLVEQAKHPLLLVSSPIKSYFDILRKKLNWAGAKSDTELPEQVGRYL